MIAKLLLQSLSLIAGMGVLLFAAAGTPRWPSAWLFLVTMALFGTGCGLWLAKTNPALLAERMRLPFQREQPAADKIFMLVFLTTFLIWIVAIGLGRRDHAESVPIALQAPGLALLLSATLLIMWVMRENSFAAVVIRLQIERGHHLVSSGPYAYVRHPMYSGIILYLAGMALLLGSWIGLALSPLFALLFAVRCAIEERTLRSGLPGYADYAARVRYRLAPGLW